MVHECYVGDSPQPALGGHRDLSPLVSLAAGKIDVNGQSSVLGSRSSHGIRPSIPALGDGGECSGWESECGWWAVPRRHGTHHSGSLSTGSSIGSLEGLRELNVQSGRRKCVCSMQDCWHVRAALRGKGDTEKVAMVTWCPEPRRRRARCRLRRSVVVERWSPKGAPPPQEHEGERGARRPQVGELRRCGWERDYTRRWRPSLGSIGEII